MARRNDEQIESHLKSTSVGPRITPQQIDSLIAREEYHVFPGSCMTVCCLTLANGFNTVGEAACADPANFDAAVGRDVAFNKARDKVFELEGYLLKQRLHDGHVSGGGHGA